MRCSDCIRCKSNTRLKYDHNKAPSLFPPEARAAAGEGGSRSPAGAPPLNGKCRCLNHEPAITVNGDEQCPGWASGGMEGGDVGGPR